MTTVRTEARVDLLERIAAKLHQGWWDFQVGLGRIFGPTRIAGTHPHLVDWGSLDEEARNQDRFIAAVLIAGWMSGRIVSDDLPEAIHNAWVLWERAHRTDHPHALPFALAHAHGPDEHALQARYILPLLSSLANH